MDYFILAHWGLITLFVLAVLSAINSLVNPPPIPGWVLGIVWAILAVLILIGR